MATVRFRGVHFRDEYHPICDTILLFQRHVDVEPRLQECVLHAFESKR